MVASPEGTGRSTCSLPTLVHHLRPAMVAGGIRGLYFVAPPFMLRPHRSNPAQGAARLLGATKRSGAARLAVSPGVRSQPPDAHMMRQWCQANCCEGRAPMARRAGFGPRVERRFWRFGCGQRLQGGLPRM